MLFSVSNKKAVDSQTSCLGGLPPLLVMCKHNLKVGQLSREDWTRPSLCPFHLWDSTVCKDLSILKEDITFNVFPHSEHPAQACLGRGEKMFAGNGLHQWCKWFPPHGPQNKRSGSGSLFATLADLNCSTRWTTWKPSFASFPGS